MHYELRNILVYGYHCLQHLFRGRFRQAGASFRGAFFRTYEAVKDPFQKNKVACNFCDWKGSQYRTFVAAVSIRRNATCPKCYSLERHRDFLKLFEKVKQCTGKEKIKLLDIAPSKSFSDYCKAHPDIDYLSVDLQSQIAMKHMDLQNLELEDETFDIVVCYHVLDYLPDDVKGMSEIYRVLKPDGIAINQEGIRRKVKETEEWGKARPEMEFRVRHYGTDFVDRWKSVGYHAQILVTDGYPTPVFLSTKSENAVNARIAKLIREDASLTEFHFS